MDLTRVHTALVCSFFLLLTFAAHAKPPADVIRFAPLPMASFEQVTREYLPFIDYLEKKTGHSFELAWYSDYATLIHAIASGDVDMAYLGPLPYVAVTQQSRSIIPVVQLLDSQGESDYTCAIVRFAGTEIQLDRNEQHYRAALTQPLSTCGYLATESYLQRHGLSLEDKRFTYEYSGSHSQVALDVILNHHDLGSMKTKIAERYHHLGLRILDETDPVPGFVLVANRDTMDLRLISQIRETLLQLKPLENPEDQEQVKAWSRNLRYGSRPVKDSAYDAIRQQWHQLKVNLIGAP